MTAFTPEQEARIRAIIREETKADPPPPFNAAAWAQQLRAEVIEHIRRHGGDVNWGGA